MTRRIYAGKLNQKVSIQKRTVAYVKGVKQENWQDYYTNSAELLDLYGTEKYSAYNAELENSIKFKFRSCDKLMAIIVDAKEYRAIWNKGTYKIIFADSLNGSKTEFILQVNKVS